MDKVKIIAEAGINHNGSLKKAIQLIREAKKAQADYVKFQIFKAENVVTKKAKKSKYQKRNSKDKESQYQMIKKFELPYDNFKIIKKECLNNRIKFLCSPFDIESLKYLKSLGEKIVKIPSGEITNYPLIKEIGKLNIRVILSTGMSKNIEIKNALNLLINNGTQKKNISILHCNTAYPTPANDVNLHALKEIKKKFGVQVGYSDHTLGTEIPVAAVCFGAKIIEKHITIDKNLSGPDHKSSLNPIEFALMVKSIRNIEKALVPMKKTITQSEKPNYKIVRKSIVAKKKISKGDIMNESNLTTKRPGNGISPMNWKYFIGKIARRSYKVDDFIEW